MPDPSPDPVIISALSIGCRDHSRSKTRSRIRDHRHCVLNIPSLTNLGRFFVITHATHSNTMQELCNRREAHATGHSKNADSGSFCSNDSDHSDHMLLLCHVLVIEHGHWPRSAVDEIQPLCDGSHLGTSGNAKVTTYRGWPKVCHNMAVARNIELGVTITFA